jgi:sorbitol/mannitol transport system substrate-binding protein
VPRDQVFISYSDRDARWRDELEIHLKPYRRTGSITSWSDKQIAPGSEWFTEIQSALANSKVAVLLVSPDFIASDFIYEHELGPLLKDAKQGGVRILWVPVRASSYEKTPLRDYQALHDPEKPLYGLADADRDAAWVKICQKIEKSCQAIDKELKTEKPPEKPVGSEDPKPPVPRVVKQRFRASLIFGSVGCLVFAVFLLIVLPLGFFQSVRPPPGIVESTSTPSPESSTAVAQGPTPSPATVHGIIYIATVNNPDMIELKKLSARFKEQNPDIKLNWVIVEENILRQRVITDVSQGIGQFDIVYIGLYETPIFAKRGWLRPFENLPSDYDLDDVFKSLRDGLSYNGKLYALPFYGESSMLMYRKDLFDAKGLKMPDKPTYEDIQKFADALTDKAKGQYGITLRGQPGWGQNMAYLGTLINTFGGAWFDMNWQPTIDTPEWTKAIAFYVDIMNKDGPPGATANGFNQNLELMSSGNAAMCIDATAAGGWLENPQQSQVAGKIGYAPSPIEVTPNGSHWLWTWALSIPTKTKNAEAAERFAAWATSKEYIKLVADDVGWASVPPGTRKSTYDNPEYQKAAPFAPTTLQAMQTADPTNPAIRPVPYTGIQFVDIPEFQSIGTFVGQNIAAALAGKLSVDQALKASQTDTERAMVQGGYTR